MAPIDESRLESVQSTEEIFGMLSTMAAVAVGLSLSLVIVICCCCRRKKPPELAVGAPTGVSDQSFFSTDPNSPEYCAECANAAAAGEQPTILAGSQLSASKGGGPTIHRYTHKTATTSPVGGESAAGAGMSVAGGGGGQSGRTVGGGGGGGGAKAAAKPGAYEELGVPAGGGPLTIMKSQYKSASNPNYQTLVAANSNVFEQGKTGKAPGGGKAAAMPTGSQMSQAQANPAYQTLFGAKSGVFDTTGKGGGKQQQVTATQALGTKSASNPAYQTLFAAQSNVFEKGGGGGGGAPAMSKVGKAAPASTSNYRA